MAARKKLPAQPNPVAKRGRPRSPDLVNAMKTSRTQCTALQVALDDPAIAPDTLLYRADVARRALNELWTLAGCDVRARKCASAGAPEKSPREPGVMGGRRGSIARREFSAAVFSAGPLLDRLSVLLAGEAAPRQLAEAAEAAYLAIGRVAAFARLHGRSA